MKHIGERIKKARERSGMNQSELARALGLTPQAVQKWESGGISPKNFRINQLANLLGTTVAYLVGDVDIPPMEEKNLPGLKIKMLANKASMGIGDDELSEDVIGGEIVLTRDFVDRLYPARAESLRFIHAYGDSMAPTLNSGDVLLVDTSAKDVKIDGIYVLKAHDRLFVKRVRQRMDGQYEISSDNPTHKTVDVLNGDNQVSVIGRVVFYWNGRKVS